MLAQQDASASCRNLCLLQGWLSTGLIMDVGHNFSSFACLSRAAQLTSALVLDL